MSHEIVEVGLSFHDANLLVDLVSFLPLRDNLQKHVFKLKVGLRLRHLLLVCLVLVVIFELHFGLELHRLPWFTPLHLILLCILLSSGLCLDPGVVSDGWVGIHLFQTLRIVEFLQRRFDVLFVHHFLPADIPYHLVIFDLAEKVVLIVLSYLVQQALVLEQFLVDWRHVRPDVCVHGHLVLIPIGVLDRHPFLHVLPLELVAFGVWLRDHSVLVHQHQSP